MGRPPPPLDKTSAGKALMTLLELVRNNPGRNWGTGSSDFGSPEFPELDSLTPRESHVLSMLAEGHSNKQIATLLGLEELTIKSYVRTIYDKLGVKNRVQAARIWWRSMSPDSSRSVLPCR